MKFYLPKHGEIRTVKRFTLFPIIHDGIIYWLELVALYQKFDALGAKWKTISVRSIKLGERIN